MDNLDKSINLSKLICSGYPHVETDSYWVFLYPSGTVNMVFH